MDFISWLDDHIVSGKRIEGIIRSDVHLEDVNDNVKIWVKGVGQAVVGIPDDMGQWRILKEGGWYKTCDFIVFGEHPRYGLYVFLVELKATPEDLEELSPDKKDGGRMELRWNISIFHYLFSLFRTDQYNQELAFNYTVRRFLIGNKYSRALNARFKKEGVKGRVFDHERYNGVWINLLATAGTTFPVTVTDMIIKSK